MSGLRILPRDDGVAPDLGWVQAEVDRLCGMEREWPSPERRQELERRASYAAYLRDVQPLHAERSRILMAFTLTMLRPNWLVLGDGTLERSPDPELPPAVKEHLAWLESQINATAAAYLRRPPFA